MKIRKTGWVLTIIFLAALVLGACSPKQQGRWNQDTNINLGQVPSDACMVNGNPVVLNANTESDGGFSLIYVRNNGDIVIRAWLTDPVTGIFLKPAGQFYWTGGHCPSQ
jgi:hypothetical protein